MVEPMDVDSLPPPPPPRLVQYGPYVSARLQKSLRECQKDALNELVRWFQSDEKNPLSDVKKNESTAVVVMPTGSGKTGVICSLPFWFGNAIHKQQLDIKLQQPILVIAPGLDILKQLECHLVESAGEKPCFLVKVGAIKDNRDREHNELRDVLYRVQVTRTTKDVRNLRCCQEDIVLTNAQKWRDQPVEGPTWRDLEDDLFSIIIIDEAHHLPAPQWQDIIDKFHRHAKIIFFTATPYRTDGDPITKSIKTYGFAYTLDDGAAVEKGIIRPIQFEKNLTKFGVGEAKYKYDPKNAAIHKDCVEAVVDKVIKCVQSKDRECPLPNAIPHCAMLITANTSEAEKVAQVCRDKYTAIHGQDNEQNKGIVMHVHSIMPKKELKTVMKKIEQKEVRVLVIVKKLLEGFDYPRVSVAGIVTRIRSPLVFAQFVGRARRVIDGEYNVVADIITHEYFEQEEPYKTFVSGRLIRQTDDRDEMND